jgi:hypothetical protein
MRIELDLAAATVERLEAKARARGDTKVSALIAEAVDQYLRDELKAEHESNWAEFDAALAAIPAGFGEAVEARVKELRANWRTSSSTPTS